VVPIQPTPKKGRGGQPFSELIKTAHFQGKTPSRYFDGLSCRPNPSSLKLNSGNRGRNFVRQVCHGSLSLSVQDVCPLQRRTYSSSTMSAATSIATDVPHIIQPYKHLLVLLPSENFKVVDLKPDSYAPLFSSNSDRQLHKPWKVWLFLDE
jgi:hypothetical protein